MTAGSLIQNDPFRSAATRRRFTKDEFYELVENKASTSEGGRDPVHLALQKQWFIFIAHFVGANSLETVESLTDFDPNMLSPQPGFNANYIMRMTLAQISRMVKEDPVFDVSPKSPDPDDQFGAKVGKFFLHHYDDVLGYEQLRMDLALWLCCTGSAAWRTDWDALAGGEIEQIVNPFTQQPEMADTVSAQMREYAEQAGAIQKRAEGDVEAEILSPFQVIVPRGFRKLTDMPWIILETERSLDWVVDRYPKRTKDITVDDMDTSAEGQYWRRLSSMVNRHGFTIPSASAEGNETVRVRELWVPPSRRFPKGLWGRCLRKTYLEHGPHPFAEAGIDVRKMPFMRFPISWHRYVPVPGRFWGTGLVEHLIASQQDYNIARSQAQKQGDTVAHAQWLSPKGAFLTTMRNEYGDVLEYDSAQGRPELVPAPSISTITVDRMERALQDMRFIAAQGEASQGDVPAGVRSGVAIRYLQEKDTSSMSMTFKDLERGIKETQTRILVLVHKFLDVPRAIQTYGEYRQADMAIFSGSDLFGNVQVRLRKGSMVPKSQAETTELLMNLMQLGVFNPNEPKHLEIVLEAMQVGSTESLFFERNLDKRRATIENHMFMRPQVDEMTGQPQPFPGVADNDDHAVHTEEHMKLLKSDAYEVMPIVRKMAFEAHILQHQQAIAQQVQTMMAMQSPPGGSAGPGGGSQPKSPGKASQPRERKDTPGSTPSAA